MGTTTACVRRLDEDCLNRLEKVASNLAQENIGITVLFDNQTILAFASFEQARADAAIQKILSLNSSVVSQFQLTAPGRRGALIVVARPPQKLHDEWQLGDNAFDHQSIPDDQKRKLAVIETTAAMHVHFGRLTLSEAAGPPGESSIGMLEEFNQKAGSHLASLEHTAASFLKQIADNQAKLAEQHQARMQELEAQMAADRATLAAEFQKKEETLSSAKVAFDEKVRELDLRDSKAVRRGIHEKLLEELRALTQDFSLSKPTRGLRRPIFVTIVSGMIFFGLLTILGFMSSSEWLGKSLADPSKVSLATMALVLGRGIAASLVLGGLLWYFIRWADRDARQHAEGEFASKQMRLDVQRASWLVELAFEWKNEKGGDIPTDLIAQLGRGLFQPRASEEVETPPDLAAALLGAASNFKLKLPGGELEMDRKALERVAKEKPSGRP